MLNKDDFENIILVKHEFEFLNSLALEETKDIPKEIVKVFLELKLISQNSSSTNSKNAAEYVITYDGMKYLIYIGEKKLENQRQKLYKFWTIWASAIAVITSTISLLLQLQK